MSLSSFQVFLGLKQDLTRRLGIADSEIFYEPSYDADASYVIPSGLECFAEIMRTW